MGVITSPVSQAVGGHKRMKAAYPDAGLVAGSRGERDKSEGQEQAQRQGARRARDRKPQRRAPRHGGGSGGRASAERWWVGYPQSNAVPARLCRDRARLSKRTRGSVGGHGFCAGDDGRVLQRERGGATGWGKETGGRTQGELPTQARLARGPGPGVRAVAACGRRAYHMSQRRAASMGRSPRRRGGITVRVGRESKWYPCVLPRGPRRFLVPAGRGTACGNNGLGPPDILHGQTMQRAGSADGRGASSAPERNGAHGTMDDMCWMVASG